MLKMIGFLTGIVLTAAVLMGVTGDLDATGVRDRLQSMVSGDGEAATLAPTDSSARTEGATDDSAPFSSLAALETIAAEPVAEEPVDPVPPVPPGDDSEPSAESPEEGESTAPEQGAERPAAEQGEDAVHTETAYARTATGDVAPQPRADDPDSHASPATVGETGVWHAFWTPFRSEASASGFASRLARETGREYKVIRNGPGQYRVAFFHTDDNDRRARLVEIEQVSGLRLSGGEL